MTPAACGHSGAEPGWMCPHVHDGLTGARPVAITVCDVGGVACEAYCPDCRARLDTFDLETEKGLADAFASLGMRVMCLSCWRGLMRSATEYDPATMPLE